MRRETIAKRLKERGMEETRSQDIFNVSKFKEKNTIIELDGTTLFLLNDTYMLNISLDLIGDFSIVEKDKNKSVEMELLYSGVVRVELI